MYKRGWGRIRGERRYLSVTEKRSQEEQVNSWPQTPSITGPLSHRGWPRDGGALVNLSDGPLCGFAARSGGRVDGRWTSTEPHEGIWTPHLIALVANCAGRDSRPWKMPVRASQACPKHCLQVSIEQP